MGYGYGRVRCNRRKRNTERQRGKGSDTEEGTGIERAVLAAQLLPSLLPLCPSDPLCFLCVRFGSASVGGGHGSRRMPMPMMRKRSAMLET